MPQGSIKDRFQSAFEALSEDMAAFFSGHGKLNHRISRLERRVDLLERKGTRPSEK